MPFAAHPQTAAGQRFIAAAQALVPVLQSRAAEADRSATMNADNYHDLVNAGISAAFVPEELGGLGLACMHDWALGIAALARGDGSTAIAINMHLGVTRGLTLAWQAARSRGQPADAASLPLRAVAEGRMLICATATERGTDNLHPLTEATADGNDLLINGTKLFVTMSPVATHLGMNLRLRDAEGDHLATTLLPIHTPGIEPGNDWDALGMRGSGSQSVLFRDVRVPKAAVRKLGPWGRWSTPVLINRAMGNLCLVAAFLGMAERAFEITRETLASQQRNLRHAAQQPGVQHMIGEMAIELATCRSVLATATRSADQFLTLKNPSLEEAHGLMQDYQIAKWVVNQGAIRLVNHAMDVVGGSSFMSSHVLSRLYRDVRAGPFMQPGSRPEAREYIGQVALLRFPDS
jgi:alkylation response protein AidB-like acyl-CoA dehydrogenase